MLQPIVADGVREYQFLQMLKARAGETDARVVASVTDILANVKEHGDEALIAYGKRFDGCDTVQKYTYADLKAFYDSVDADFRNGLMKAKKNIEDFHNRQKQEGFSFTHKGAKLGQIVRGLDTVGLYVPGGTAAYPSSVLMNALPAKIAGVGKIIMITPPSGGRINPEVMAAAYLAGVDEAYLVGGAHGIAALAYGTESIPRVDKIVGPGNIYVATAKRLVYGTVDIDMVAGPSEIMIMADETARADYIAADLLSQAEHDRLAGAVLVTTSRQLIEALSAELERQLNALPRKEIAEEALKNNGGIVLCDSDEKMLELVNAYAPEHLEIVTKDPYALMESVRHAGSIFLGAFSPEPIGDYLAGTNHVLPTGGTARFYSPLSVDSFVKKMQYICYDRALLEEDAADCITLAEREGLHAHANAIRVRL